MAIPLKLVSGLITQFSSGDTLSVDSLGVRDSAPTNGVSILRGPISLQEHVDFQRSALKISTAATTSVDSTPVDLLTISIDEGQAITCVVIVTGHSEDDGYMASYGKVVLASRTLTDPVAINSEVDLYTDIETPAGLDGEFVGSGNNLVFQVTGVGTAEIYWVCSALYQTVVGNL